MGSTSPRMPMAGRFNESVCSPPKAPRNDGSTARSAAKEEPSTASFTGFSFKTLSLRFSPTLAFVPACSVTTVEFSLFCVFTFCAIALGHHIVKAPNKSKHILQYSFILIFFFFQQAYSFQDQSFKDQSFQATNPFKTNSFKQPIP